MNKDYTDLLGLDACIASRDTNNYHDIVHFYYVGRRFFVNSSDIATKLASEAQL